MKRQDRITTILCGIAALAVTTVASARTLEFDFDAGAFSAPTSLTNNYWGLRLDSPGPTVYFSESDDGCELSESEVFGTTGMGFFDDPYDIDAVVVRDREWVSEDCDEAEDMAKVLRLNARVSIEYGDYTGCLLTKEYTPLERGQIEHKYYCPVTPGDPGLVLVNEFSGKTKRVEYVGSTRPAGSYPMAFPTSDVCEE